MAQEIESVSITEKLKSLIATAEVWKDEMADAAKLQNGIFTETHVIATKLKDSLEENIKVAIEFSDQVKKSLNEITTASQLAAIEWTQTTGAATSAFNVVDMSKKSFAASDYVSGVSMLTDNQKAEFLRIVTDRDEYALNTLIADYKEQINKIYNDEYKSIKDRKEQLDKEQENIGNRIQELLDSLKNKEGTINYENTIKEISKLRMNLMNITQDSANIGKRISQFDESAMRIEGQMAVLKGAWDDESMRLRLSSTAVGGTGKEAYGYTKDELLWLVNKALETGAGQSFDKVALIELIKKLDSAVPTKKYQLDLTVGDQKLSAFTDLSPEKFLEALFTARKSALL